MGDFSIGTLAFVLAAGFLGGFIDSVVGGGGLVTAPAMLATGLPVPYAFGTNKVAVVGALTSFLTFYRAGAIDRVVLRFMPLSILGGALGAFTMNALPEYIMKNIVVVALVCVAIYTFFRKDWGDESHEKPFTKNIILAVGLVALGLGYYDGFFGPGAGTFLLFAFLNFGYNFVRASGNAKACNFGSNLGALLVFAASSKIVVPLGIAMAVGQVLGARTGAKMAITHGAKYVKPLFYIVTTLLIGKQVWDLFWK